MSLPVAVPKSLSSFYYFMKDKGFPIESGIYEHNEDGFMCMVFFEPKVTLDNLWKFLKLPKLLVKTNENILSSDDSWVITVGDDGVVCLSFSEAHHVGVMCYIMANR